MTIDSTRRNLTFRWVAPDTTSVDSLPAGDANNDNRINLADFGVLVRYFGATSASPNWGAAQQTNFNGDSEVGFDDFLLLADNFGRVGMQVATTARPVAASRGQLYAQPGGDGDWELRGAGLDGLRGLTVVVPAGVTPDVLAGGFGSTAHESLLWNLPDGRQRLAIAAVGDDPVTDDLLLRFTGLDAGAAQQIAASAEWLDSVGRVHRVSAATTRPTASVLHNAYPNPFNPSTTIPFDIGGVAPVMVRLEVYDVLGQQVSTLLDEPALMPGAYRVTWDARNRSGHSVASGLYFVRLTSGTTERTQRLLLLR